MFAVMPAHAEDLEVRLVSITSPVPPGGTVELVVAAPPGATCTGRRQPHQGLDIPIATQVVPTDGKVRWTFQVLKGLNPVGLRSIHVTCTLDRRQGSMDTSFAVAF